jgi:hypothetical protein
MAKITKRVIHCIRLVFEIWGYLLTIRTIGLSLAGATAMTLAIREWLVGLDTLGSILVFLFIFGIVLTGITYIYEWRRTISVRYLPTVILNMNNKMRLLIELAGYPAQEIMESACKDLAEIFNIDIKTIEKTYRYGRKIEIRKMFSELLSTRPNPVPTNELHKLLQSLLDIQGIFNHYQIGLDSIKDEQYKRLERQFESLKEKTQLSPSNAQAIRPITNYYFWWEGLCNLLLLLHYDKAYYIPTEVLPAKVRAILPNVTKQIEGIIANLHSDIVRSMAK